MNLNGSNYQRDRLRLRGSDIELNSHKKQEQKQMIKMRDGGHSSEINKLKGMNGLTELEGR